MKLEEPDGSWSFRREGGGLVCTRTHRLARLEDAFDASGARGYVALVSRHGGSLAYRVGAARVDPGARHVALVPPKSLVRTEFDGRSEMLEVTSEIGIVEGPDVAWPRYAVSLDAARLDAETVARAVRGDADAIARVASAPDAVCIAADRHARPLVRRAKLRLDELLDAPDASVGALAAELGVAHAQLTRAFSADLGVTPIRYRNLARVTTAAMRLLLGADVATTAHGVGFADLGRFYEQFRTTTSITPARYRLGAELGGAQRRRRGPGRS